MMPTDRVHAAEVLEIRIPRKFAAGFGGVGLNAEEEITGRAYNPVEFRHPNRMKVVAEAWFVG
jgi:hypothetical protein